MFDMSAAFYLPSNLSWGALDFVEVDGMAPLADPDLTPETAPAVAGLTDPMVDLLDAGLPADLTPTPNLVATPDTMVTADPDAPLFDLSSFGLDAGTGEPFVLEIDYAALDASLLEIGQALSGIVVWF